MYQPILARLQFDIISVQSRPSTEIKLKIPYESQLPLTNQEQKWVNPTIFHYETIIHTRARARLLFCRLQALIPKLKAEPSEGLKIQRRGASKVIRCPVKKNLLLLGLPKSVKEFVPTNYRRLVRKLPSLHSQKYTPIPKLLGSTKAYFFCHIGPNFHISLIYAFIGCPQFVLVPMYFRFRRACKVCRATSSRTKINVPHILRRWQRPPASLRGRQPHTVGPNGKNVPLIKPKQRGKLIGHTYNYNNLTDFEMEVHPKNQKRICF